MASYRIVNANTTLGVVGAVVNSDDFADINFDALVAGEFVEPCAPAVRKHEKKEQE